MAKISHGKGWPEISLDTYKQIMVAVVHGADQYWRLNCDQN
jgi:hypothetical protein